MAGGVFISYRRSDSAAFAGRIADFFAYNYPDVRVFFDVSGIAPGEDFVDVIQSRINSSAVILAIIGESWLNSVDANGQRRLDNPQDFVHLELASAFELGARVIPVLLDNAQMPSAEQLPEDLRQLAWCNAEFMRGAAFQRDMQHLADFVADFVAQSDQQVFEPEEDTVTEPGSPVYEGLVGALQQFCFKSSDESFIILETNSGTGSFVQYAKTGPDEVVLDLPSVMFKTEEQQQAAHQFFSETYSGTTVDLGDMFTYQLVLPKEPSYLAHVTLEVLERLFGEVPTTPLSYRIDA